MKRTYLDYAASTPMDNTIAEIMMPLLTVTYGNPSAIHFDGLVARRAINSAREKIANTLGVPTQTCIFTSSATESIGLSLLGSVARWRQEHPEQIPEVLITPIEHDSVLAYAKKLESEGVNVIRIPVDAYGLVSPKDVYDRLTKNTVLVSIGLVNNEIGAIQPLSEVAKEIRRYKKNERGVTRSKSAQGDDMYPLLHTDATQAVNYHDMNIPRLGVDLLSCNSAKIYGPKGIGLLYKGSHVPLETHLVGGGQEFGLRSGTEDTGSIVGFSEAFVFAQKSAIDESLRLLPMRESLFAQIRVVASENNLAMMINGPLLEQRVVNNVHFSFDKTNHEYLVLLLDNEGFSVSTKSACNETKAEESHVLAAIDDSMGNKRPHSGIRVTMGRQTKQDDIDAFVLALRKVLPLACM